MLPQDKRAFLFNEHDLLLLILPGDDRLMVKKVALKEAIQRPNRLVVVSPAAVFTTAGQSFSHQIRVSSRVGNLTYSLIKQPPSMSIMPDGTLNWTPSSRFVGREVIAVVTIRDASGQDVVHTLNILVR
jgi:hypothetical protein